MHAMSSSWDGISTSSISVTAATTGCHCHMLKIDGYSKTKLFCDYYGYGYAMSTTFEAAGQAWNIKFQPNGTGSDGYISLYIKPCPPITGTTRATICFSLVPHVGKPAPPPYGKRLTTTFNAAYVLSTGVPRFIKMEELEKSGYLMDDCFAIRCDVEVVKMVAAAEAVGPAVDEHDLERLAVPCTCEDSLCKRIHQARTVEAASPGHPATAADGACTCKDGLCEHCTMKAPPQQRHRRAMAAWLRLFTGSGKSETKKADHQRTCRSLKKPLLSEIN
ncbi:hypothetical protein HU200_045804 [Digitaria exilis]|uniref:MATH domain-containing protein n=1 Tax=Digitaria exilis TaxID=1010633 RepID=A0A835AZI4_9POAL|nr:hypothetical protein HU200_045804 [Digitaria exilis]